MLTRLEPELEVGVGGLPRGGIFQKQYPTGRVDQIAEQKGSPRLGKGEEPPLCFSEGQQARLKSSRLDPAAAFVPRVAPWRWEAEAEKISYHCGGSVA